MERIQVSSSNLASVGYDDASQTLEVEFKRGTVYQYHGVPEVLHQSLMAAPSAGTFFNANIRNVFPCEQVG
jgi:hypothetical protein